MPSRPLGIWADHAPHLLTLGEKASDSLLAEQVAPIWDSDPDTLRLKMEFSPVIPQDLEEFLESCTITQGFSPHTSYSGPNLFFPRDSARLYSKKHEPQIFAKILLAAGLMLSSDDTRT
ncbi:hypothetical protein GcC1_096033, partial [Golovinomyces cichoracearum]